MNWSAALESAKASWKNRPRIAAIAMAATSWAQPCVAVRGVRNWPTPPVAGNRRARLLSGKAAGLLRVA
jgi:hypothetical protein